MSKLQYLLQNKLNTDVQRAKKLASDSPGLVDFAIGLVNSVLNLPDGQVKIFEEFKLHKNCVINPAYQNDFGASWNEFWASACQLQLAQMATCKTDFLCTLDVALFTTYIKSVFQQIRLLSGWPWLVRCAASLFNSFCCSVVKQVPFLLLILSTALIIQSKFKTQLSCKCWRLK